MLPRVLIGCPTYEGKEYCLQEYADAVKNLSYKNYDVMLVDNSKGSAYINKIRGFGLNAMKTEHRTHARDSIVEGRNLLAKKSLEYDYFLSLEQDVIPPRDVIEKLMRHEKDITSGVYRTYQNINGQTRQLPLLFVSLNKEENKMRYLTDAEIDKLNEGKEDAGERNGSEGNGLIEIRSCGIGCLLIKKNVLEKIKFRYVKGVPGFDDVHFCNDALKAGFRIYADATVRCDHLYGGGWSEIKK